MEPYLSVILRVNVPDLNYQSQLKKTKITFMLESDKSDGGYEGTQAAQQVRASCFMNDAVGDCRVNPSLR